MIICCPIGQHARYMRCAPRAARTAEGLTQAIMRLCTAIVPRRNGSAAAYPPHRELLLARRLSMLYPRRRRVRTTPRTPAQLLHAALTAYGLNRRTLRQLASQDAADLHAMLHDPHPPPELLALLDLQ